MESKKPSDTRVEMALLMQPQHANPAGNVHGGVVMKTIDDAAGAVAIRHAQSNVVTASLDRMDFIAPVYVGDLVTFRACLNRVGRSSMEIGVRVESENMITGEVRHTASAYLTFVALDENGRSREVPGLVIQDEECRRRWDEAGERWAERNKTRSRV